VANVLVADRMLFWSTSKFLITTNFLSRTLVKRSKVEKNQNILAAPLATVKFACLLLEIVYRFVIAFADSFLDLYYAHPNSAQFTSIRINRAHPGEWRSTSYPCSEELS
jgi:hypothetical protein